MMALYSWLRFPLAHPVRLVEEFDLDGTRVAGRVDSRTYAPQLDYPVPHHRARHQRVLVGHRPVVNVEAFYTPCGAFEYLGPGSVCRYIERLTENRVRRRLS